MVFWAPLLLALQESLFGFQETFVYLDKKECDSKIKLSKRIFSKTLLHSLVKIKAKRKIKVKLYLTLVLKLKAKTLTSCFPFYSRLLCIVWATYYNYKCDYISLNLKFMKLMNNFLHQRNIYLKVSRIQKWTILWVKFRNLDLVFLHVQI